MSGDIQKLQFIAGRFYPSGRVREIRGLGRGNINRTFLVVTGASPGDAFVLQQVNTHVFREPERVMTNMRLVTEHLRHRLRSGPLPADRRWRVPYIIPAEDGRDYWQASDGAFWRALEFIEEARPLDVLTTLDEGREAGFALGLFHLLLHDLSADRLADTIEGFHVTPRYLRHYQRVLAERDAPDTPDVRYALQFIRERESGADILERGRAEGQLLLRPIHGDPKCNNILIDLKDGKAVSLIDLDTVKPGLIHYDIGDCLRSGCNPSGEESLSGVRPRFDVDMAGAMLQGYLSVARPFLTQTDYGYIYDSVRLIAFELGLRFFTDYLEGNVYFRTRHPEQNLRRALIQFRLVESIEKQERDFRAVIRALT